MSSGACVMKRTNITGFRERERQKGSKGKERTEINLIN